MKAARGNNHSERVDLQTLCHAIDGGPHPSYPGPGDHPPYCSPTPPGPGWSTATAPIDTDETGEFFSLYPTDEDRVNALPVQAAHGLSVSQIARCKALVASADPKAKKPKEKAL